MAVAGGCASDVVQQECAGFTYVENVRDARLADLPELKPIVNGVYFDATGGNLTVILAYGGAQPSGNDDQFSRYAGAIGGGDTAYCPTMEADPAFTATLDGIDGTAPSAGGWMCLGPSGAACRSPAVQFTGLPPAQDATLTIADRSRSLALPLADLLGAPRSATPSGGGDWTFHAGQQVSLQWSSTADLVALPAAVVVFTTPCAGCPSGQQQAFEIHDGFTRGTDTISFTLPAAVATGTMSITLEALGADRGAYYLTTAHSVSHAATILP